VQVLHHIYPDWRSRPGSPIINFFGFLFQRFSLYLIRKRADIIIVLNDNVRNWLIKEGVPPERIFLSSNAIDSMGFKSKLPIQFDAVYLGRIDPTKGSNDFIPIWDFVCHQNSKAKLALIGTITPSEKQKLLSEISKSGLDKNIKIFGFLKVSEVQQILSSSKIFIFPSHEEGWGIAIAEAMSYGLPVVCWKLDNLTKVFFDHPCYAVPFDYHDFSHQVLELLDNSREAESIGAKNADFVKKFSWEKVASTEFEKIKSALVCNNKTTKILHSITHDK
ncbi:MAG TPA: glycosyltransferase family 4 protein, partial [Patescibacteria group bacterium]